MAERSLARLVAMAKASSALATQLAIDVRLFETRLGAKS